MARKKPKAKELSKETYQICPHASPTCKICQLPVDDIKEIHRLKIEEKKPYTWMVEYAKEKYGWGKNNSLFTTHFKKHISAIDKKMDDTSKALIAEVLPPLTQTQSSAQRSAQLQKAYIQITEQVASFADNVSLLNDVVNINAANQKKLEEELKNKPIIEQLEILATFNKELRSQVKDVSALGAPKVLVRRFLESTLNRVTQEMSRLFYELCGSLQGSVLHDLKEKNIPVETALDKETFVRVFQPLAKEFKARMETINKEQMANADAALAEMEKII